VLEISLTTFHDKEFGARVELSLARLAAQEFPLGYAIECARMLKTQSFYQPVGHIVRFLATCARGILVKGKTKCQFGEPPPS
jgi:hypothetical protein